MSNSEHDFRNRFLKLMEQDQLDATKKHSEVLTIEDKPASMATQSKCSRCIELEREVVKLRSELNDYQWERDARNGHVQGMW